MENKEIEALLKKLQPVKVGSETLMRFDNAMNGVLPVITPEIRQIEAFCSSFEITELDPKLNQKLEEILFNVPYPITDKVILFPRGHSENRVKQPSAKRKNHYYVFAAVATIGGLLALITPLRKESLGKIPQNISMNSSGLNNGIVTTNFGTGVKNLKDEGVIWSKNEQPSRAIRVNYQDRVLVRDAQGIERMLLVPREELVILPEKIN
jgi:hypothetical protein